MGEHEGTDAELDEAIMTVTRALYTGQKNKAKVEAQNAWQVVQDRLQLLHKTKQPPKP